MSGFRLEFYDALATRADGLFEFVDAMLCAHGPVKALVELSLAPKHRARARSAVRRGERRAHRPPPAAGHGRRAAVPRAADGRLVLAVDVSNWLRPDAATSPQRLFCHIYGRGRSADQFIPDRSYSFVAALEIRRTSWTALLDAIRLGPQGDPTAITVAQLREVVERLITSGHWQPGDPRILIVADTDYDLPRLAFVLRSAHGDHGSAARGPGALPPHTRQGTRRHRRRPKHGEVFARPDPPPGRSPRTRRSPRPPATASPPLAAGTDYTPA